MDIGCLFAPTTHTPDPIAEAERLGYSYAYVYGSPSLFADAWMTLGRAADRTSRIRLGAAGVTPKLRHLVDNAAAAVTLAALAPGRVDVVVGAGFTSAALLGRKGARWSEAKEYIQGLRALMAGEEIDWEGARITLTFPGHSGLAPVTDVPVLAAAHGPEGFAVASYVPAPGETRLIHLVIPPDTVYMSEDFDPAAAVAERLETSPGLAELFEPDALCMHTTPTVDYGVLLQGELVLELDDELEVTLAPGDLVVQNGTRHAWRNRTDVPATMLFVLIGARRNP